MTATNFNIKYDNTSDNKKADFIINKKRHGFIIA